MVEGIDRSEVVTPYVESPLLGKAAGEILAFPLMMPREGE